MRMFSYPDLPLFLGLGILRLYLVCTVEAALMLSAMAVRLLDMFNEKQSFVL